MDKEPEVCLSVMMEINITGSRTGGKHPNADLFKPVANTLQNTGFQTRTVEQVLTVPSPQKKPFFFRNNSCGGSCWGEKIK